MGSFEQTAHGWGTKQVCRPIKWTGARCEALGDLIDQGATPKVAAAHFGVSVTAVTLKAKYLGWQFGVPRTPEQKADRPWERILERRKYGKDGRLRVQISVDEETFDEVCERARAANKTRTEILRDLVEWGLLAC